MMTSNSTQILSSAAFTHVLDNVLQNSRVSSALNEQGICDIFGLMILTDDIVDNLVYPDSDPQVQIKHSLKRGEIGLIKSFIHYMYYLQELGNTIGDDWTNITMDDFDQFRSNLSYTSRFGSLSTLVFKPSTAASSSSSTPFTDQAHSPCDKHKYGSKCNSSVCPTMKDEEFNDQWQNYLVNQDESQDISETFDAFDVTYEPSTATDSAVSWEQIQSHVKLKPSIAQFSKEPRKYEQHVTAYAVEKLGNQVFHNDAKEKEAYQPHDKDLFDITKRDPDYYKLPPFLATLYPANVGTSKHCDYALLFNIITTDYPNNIYQSIVTLDTVDDYNLRASMFGGEKSIHNVIHCDHDSHNHHPHYDHDSHNHHHSFMKLEYDFDIMDESKPADTSNNGETSNETLSVIVFDDPVSCKTYAKDFSIITSDLEWDPCIWYHDFEPDNKFHEISFIKFDDAIDHENRDLEDYNLSQTILTPELEWDHHIWYHEFEHDDQWSEISFIDTKLDDADDHRSMNLLELEESLEWYINASLDSKGNVSTKDNAIEPDHRRYKKRSENCAALNPCKNDVLHIYDSQPGLKCSELPTLISSKNISTVDIYRVHDRGKF
jgi:hypothetical protein